MTQFVHLDSGDLISFDWLRREHPTTSFPSLDRMTDADLLPYRVAKVIQTPQPVAGMNQRARLAGVDGRALVWVLDDLSEDEIAAALADRFAEARRNIDLAVRDRIEAQARALGYDSTVMAALRAAYPGPWLREGVAFAQWMDACWQAAYDAMSVDAEPRSVTAVLAALPAWEAP